MKSFAAALSAAAFAITLSAQTSAPPAAGEKFVPTALCRLLDTRMTPPANAAEAALRQVDVRTTMCSPLLPPFATAYAIRTTSFSLLPPEKVPASDRPVVTTSRIRAVGPLQFAVPAGRNVTVDVDGYFVPAGMPISPVEQGSMSTSAFQPAATAESHVPLTPGSNASLTGSTGAVYTDGTVTGFTTSGLLLQATSAASPFITAQTPTSDASSSISFVNSSKTSLMTVAGDGTVTIPSTLSYFNGRTAYWPVATNGVTPMPGDYVHNVVVQKPRNAENNTTTRIVFFQGGTLYEDAGSPPITKFQAYTTGDGQQSNNINFDSMVWYHFNQYHYRAFSSSENKDTFWVKAATSGDSATNTRADMYVSGNVGIGTTPTAAKLQVTGDARIDGNLTVSGNIVNSTQLQAGQSGVTVSTGGTAIAHLLGAWPNFSGWTNNLSWSLPGVWNEDDPTLPGWYASLYTGSPDGFSVIRIPAGPNPHANPAEWKSMLTVQAASDGSPKVGIGVASPTRALDVAGDANFTGTVTGGNIHANYQDVAEWVPATEAMTAGTVVVLNASRSNEVMASFRAYDTAVAGVVSERPGVILGTASPSKAQIATIGRVRVKVDATKHAVAVGDLLVTSDKPGMAMVSEPVDLGGVKIHRPGTLIGKALEPLRGGEGEILVLLSLQ